jgi:amino acid transporter
VISNEPVVELRRELGLRDLILFAISCIIGVRWIPGAIHGGPGLVTLWLLGALLFVVPLASAIGALGVKYPGAGGMYLWTRNDFGPWHGFLCFWVYWMAIAFWYPSAAMFYMSAAVYTLGPSYRHLADDHVFLVAASLAAIWIALGTNLIGMKVGKWTENLGGIATWGMGVLFLTLAILVWAKRGAAANVDFVPQASWKTANSLAGIAYAMTGLELVALMGAEIRDPSRTLPRAGWISSGFAAIFYSAMTVALLVLVRPENIDELNGLAQGGAAAGLVLGWHWLSPVIAMAVLATGIGQFGGLGTSVSRMPFAAGIDHLLPPAFAKIHPRWGTPHVSILVLGGVASFLLVVTQLGDTLRAAYQTLVSLMVLVGFLPFIYIFASAWKAGTRLSALSGWGVTVLAVVCSVVPTEQVTNIFLFEVKIAIGTIAVIATGWLVYRQSNR